MSCANILSLVNVVSCRYYQDKRHTTAMTYDYEEPRRGNKVIIYNIIISQNISSSSKYEGRTDDGCSWSSSNCEFEEDVLR